MVAPPTLKWQAAKPGEIPLWLADMDLPVAPAIRDALTRYVDSSWLTYGGDPSAAEDALARWLARRHSMRISSDSTLWMSDVTQCVAASVLALSEPSDSVILCTPAYPPLFRAIREAGREVVAWPMIQRDGRFVLDIDTLERLLHERQSPLLILSSPHNPTGRVFTVDELRAVEEVLANSRTVVVSDEIFADVLYSGHTHTPFVTAVGAAQATRTVTLWSASKAFNVAGLKCAVLICGDHQLRSRFDVLSPTLLSSPGILGLAAATAAWTAGEPWLCETLALLEVNRRLLFDALAVRLPELDGVAPDGTFMAWLDASRLAEPTGAQPFLLKYAGVDLAAGEDFGPGGDGFVRMSFATPTETLELAIDAMVHACQRDRGRVG